MPDANLTIPENIWLSGQALPVAAGCAIRRPEPRDHSSGESVVDSGFTSHSILNGVVGRCLFLPIAAPSLDFGGTKLPTLLVLCLIILIIFFLSSTRCRGILSLLRIINY